MASARPLPAALVPDLERQLQAHRAQVAARGGQTAWVAWLRESTARTAMTHLGLSDDEAYGDLDARLTGDLTADASALESLWLLQALVVAGGEVAALQASHRAAPHS